MTALVTGAAGFLGSHVSDLLIARGERPRALVLPDDKAARLAASGVDLYRGDITDRATLRTALDGVDRVFHCAARTGPWGPRSEYEATNVRALETLVTAALAVGVRRIVHVSTASVHGVDVHGAADESTPLRGGPDPYCRSKLAGERVLQRIISETGAPITIVRPGLIYGPEDFGSFGRFATLLDQRKMVIIGSGNNHLPLIYVTDVAEAILAASVADLPPGREYLLVNDEVVTQRRYLDTIAAALGVPRPSRHIPYRLALAMGLTAEITGHLARSAQSPPITRFGVRVLGGENRFLINRARSEFGFVPRTSLTEGVHNGIAWYRRTHCPAPV